jgi:5-methyltetrahydrofolate--homocysteine methyltransferase
MADLFGRIKNGVLIGPGDLPTNAVDLGFNLLDSPGLWAVKNPDAYQKLLRSWLNTGVDFVSAYTEHAFRVRLKSFDLQDRAPEINRGLLRLTREVMPSDCYLVCRLSRASLFVPPLGDASMDEVCEAYREQIEIIEDFKADLLLVSMAALDEMEPVITAMRGHSKLPIGALVSFNPTPKGFRTMMGVDPTTAAEKLDKLGADIVGVTCGGINYEETTAVLKEMAAVCDRPLFARPNSGVPDLIDGKVIHPGTPEGMALEAVNWVEAGARLISGCCGTTPEHIKQIVTTLKTA